MSATVGIDIGASAVRVVEVAGTNRDSYAQITRAATAPVQPGAVVGGRIEDPTAVAWALTRALKEAKVSGYGVVLGLTGALTAVSRVSMPAALAPQEWSRVLRTAGREISPKIPIGSSALSMYPLAPVGADPTAERVLLAAAAKQDQLDAVLHVCREAKIVPRAVDLAGAATMRCMTRATAGNADVATLVDIGATKITVATREGLHLRSLRTLEHGADRITKALMGRLECSGDEAEQRKRSMRPGTSESAAVTNRPARYGVQETSVTEATDIEAEAQEVLSTAIDQLVEAIAVAIENDASAHPDAPSEGIVLAGGGALQRGLKERLVRRTGVAAMVGRPWATVVPSKATRHLLVNGSEDPVTLLSLATATGLAMWKEPELMARTDTHEPAQLVASATAFDFLEGAFARAQRSRRIGIGSAMTALVTLSALALTGVMAGLSTTAARDELARTQAADVAATKRLAQIDTAGGYTTDALTRHLAERSSAYTSAVGSEVDVVRLVRDIRDTAPSGVTVTSIKVTDTAAAATGTAPIAGATTPAAPATSLGTIEVVGTARDFSLIGAWAKGLSRVKGVSGVNPTWAGGGAAITTTLTATVNPSGATTRAANVTKERP